MASIIPMAIRQQVVRSFENKESVSSISRRLKISRNTVYKLLRRYKEQGQQGLQPRYHNCGKIRPDRTDLIFRAVRCFKTWHPHWGAPKIHAELACLRPDLPLPMIRTINRWFHWNKQAKKPQTSLPKSDRYWSKDLHHSWQIDAKEAIQIADGSQQCWLNITDECSGTVVDPPVFSL